MSMSEHHGEKELAAFIRAGAARREEQAFGDYFKGKHASCALGAAYEGMYRLPDNADGTRPTKDLEWFFDCLEGTDPEVPGRRLPASGSPWPRSSSISTTTIAGRASRLPCGSKTRRRTGASSPRRLPRRSG